MEIYRLLAATRPSYPSPNGSEQPLNGAAVGSPVGDEYLWEDAAQKKPLRRTPELLHSCCSPPHLLSLIHDCGGIGVLMNGSGKMMEI